MGRIPVRHPISSSLHRSTWRHAAVPFGQRRELPPTRIRTTARPRFERVQLSHLWPGAFQPSRPVPVSPICPKPLNRSA